MLNGVDVSYKDPYVGQVYGNIVDYFDNPSYSIRLFMVRKQISDRLTEESIFSSDKLLQEGGKQEVQPKDIVVIAQTGVTGTQIDDMTIMSLADNDVPLQLNYEFTLIQPGAANLMDQIIAAKKYLGYEPGPNVTAYLEFRWQGYRAGDLNDAEDEGGQQAVIAGPIRYKILIQRIGVNIDSTGSRYQCEAIRFGDHGFRDTMFTFPQSISTKGATVTEHVKFLEKQLNKWHREETPYDEKDVIDIDLRYLVRGENTPGDALTLEDDRLDTENIEAAVKLMNDKWDVESEAELFQRQVETTTKGSTEQELQQDVIQLTMPKGTTINQYMLTLLAMCDEVYTRISRLEDLTNRRSKAKAGQGFFNWFKVTTDMYEIKYDPSRISYAYRYQYTPRMYKSARSDVAIAPEENSPTSDEKTTRLDEYKKNGSLIKAYNYIFTGLNDQILDLNLQYDNGALLMVAPREGNIGEYGITQGVRASPSVPQSFDPDTTGAEQIVEEVQREQVQASLLDFINNVSDSAGSIRDQFTDIVTDLTGISPAEVSGLLNDVTGAQAQSFVNALDNQTLRRVADGTGVAPQNNTPTESTTVTSGPGGEYIPDFSGLVYSEDFVLDIDPGSVSAGIDPELLVERGFITGQDQAEDAFNKQPLEAAKNKESPVKEAGVKLGSTRTKLFGVLTDQVMNNLYMMNLEMDVRGDPWYMGAPNLDGRSTLDRANFRGDDNLFWLRIAAPSLYDPDWSDEDSEINSGYWQANGTSYTFTGVYRMLRVTNKFSGGLHSVKIEAHRLHNLDAPLDGNLDGATQTNEPNPRDSGATVEVPTENPNVLENYTNEDVLQNLLDERIGFTPAPSQDSPIFVTSRGTLGTIPNRPFTSTEDFLNNLRTPNSPERDNGNP